MKLKTLILTLTIMLAACVLGSCRDEAPAPAPGRAILIYMVDNNDLHNYSELDLLEMKQAMRRISEGRVLVYRNPTGTDARLFELTSDGSEHTLRSYPASESSVTIARMKQVVTDFNNATSSATSRGLVLWSHATGWLADQDSFSDPDFIAPLSFGRDETGGTKKMKLPALAQALEGNRFDFIYFDCCHMATVEVAYELRALTPYIIASPTELGTDGMPYTQNLPLLLSETPQLSQALANTFGFYNNPLINGCAITLIATEGLEELANACRQPLLQKLPDGYSPVPYFRKAVMQTGIFDMRHYFHALTESRPDLRKAWDEAYNQVVVEFHTTPSVYGLNASEFSGLGVNIVNEDNPPYTYGYHETAWYRHITMSN